MTENSTDNLIETNAAWLDELKWNDQGLIAAIAQDEKSGDVLMMAWMNKEALAQTAATGKAVYWSRSRGKLWQKGESSGHVQTVSDIRTDCDADVILLKVSQAGGIACHTGRYSCFYRQLDQSGWCETEPVIKDPGEIYSPKD